MGSPPRLFRPRLVLPVKEAGSWAHAPGAFLSPGGALVFVPLVVDEAGLWRVLEDMAERSKRWKLRNPGAPPILETCRYEREPEGENDYLLLPVSLGLYNADYEGVTGHRPMVDCEDLEIGVSGEAKALGDAGAHPEPTRVGETMWHIRTRFGNGQIQDSTRIQLKRQGQQASWTL